MTLDDGLHEQLDVALPVLDEYHLKACWHPYTQVYCGVPHSLETFRWIRNFAFGGVDGFYEAWRNQLDPVSLDFAYGLFHLYLGDREYLTVDDRAFRYWRDKWLDPIEYELAMKRLVGAAYAPLPVDHWIQPNELRALHADGHVIGFHTHTHPTTMGPLNHEQTAVEYATSRYILAGILGVVPEAITTCAMPCGSVNRYTEDWLRENGVTLAWGATMDGTIPFNAPRWSTGYWR